jgi:integrase
LPAIIISGGAGCDTDLLCNDACPDAFLPGVCLKLFAGLRTSELLSLDWSEVSTSEIVIRGAKAKTRQRRIVAISENLAAWLQPLRRPSGRVVPFLQNALASLT